MFICDMFNIIFRFLFDKSRSFVFTLIVKSEEFSKSFTSIAVFFVAMLCICMITAFLIRKSNCDRSNRRRAKSFVAMLFDVQYKIRDCARRLSFVRLFLTFQKKNCNTFTSKNVLFVAIEFVMIFTSLENDARNLLLQIEHDWND
jgi:hypothetical protein